MKFPQLVVVVAAWISCGAATLAQSRQPTIVLNGGNGMGREVTGPLVEMAGGPRAVVAVIIHADGPGKAALDDWRRSQAAEVVPVSVNDLVAGRPVLDRATLLWFAGGFSTKLMDAISGTYLPQYIRDRWAEGVVVGGDSAGGMIFPELILTGEADLTSIAGGRTKTAAGIGLLPILLFDPHFVKRQRLNRLVGLVLDHPDRIGVGADEKTAVVIRGSRLEVLGASNVVLIDARRGEVPRQLEGNVSAGRDIRMHVLTHGMTFDFGSAEPRP